MILEERLAAFALHVRAKDDELRALVESKAAPDVVFVRSYLESGATAAQNATAINQAISDANAVGASACFDGVECQISSEILLSTPGTRVWSSSAVACVLTQISGLSGQGVFRVAANDVTIDGFTLNSTVPMTTGMLDLTGFTGDAHEVSAIKVNPGVENPTLRRIKGSNWFILLGGYPYPIGQETTADPATFQFIKGLVVEDIEAENVWGAVRMSGLDDADFSNVRGSYVIATGHIQVNTAPPHLFYISMPTINSETPKAYNKNVRIRDCHARSGPGGAPFSLRYTEGMTWSNLTADDCEGIVDMIGVKGFTGAGAHSTRDRYPKDNLWNGNRGSFSLTYCNDGVVEPVLIEGATDFTHGSLFYIGSCENITMVKPKGWIDLTTADTALRASYFSGRNIRIVQPEIESRGASCAIAFLLAEGFSGDSTVHIDDPRTKGAFLRDFDLTVTTTKSRIAYDPAKLVGVNQQIRTPATVTTAGFPVLDNLAWGYPPEDEDTRTIGWFHGEKLGDNGQLRIRWPSGQISSIHTDAWVATTPPYINANATVTGLLAADLGVANVEVECKIKHGSGSVGLLARAVDTNNFLQVVLTATSLILAKRVAGTYTTLVTVPLPESGSGVWHNVKVRAVGARITVTLDDALAIAYTLTGTDATTFTTPTNHGLRSDNGGASSVWYGLRIRQI